MAVSGSLQLSLQLGICRSHGRSKRFRVNSPLRIDSSSSKSAIFPAIFFFSEHHLFSAAESGFKRQIMYVERQSAFKFTGIVS